MTMTLATKTDRLADAIEATGQYVLAARVGSTRLGLVTVQVDPEWEPDATDPDDAPTYTIETDDEVQWASDLEEARMGLAGMVRDLRNAHIEEQADRDADEATDAVTALVESGRAADVLKALRAAGLL